MVHRHLPERLGEQEDLQHCVALACHAKYCSPQMMRCLQFCKFLSFKGGFGSREISVSGDKDHGVNIYKKIASFRSKTKLVENVNFLTFYEVVVICMNILNIPLSSVKVS